MTVQELIDRLSEYDPDAEVRIGSQESYPFQNALSGIVTPAEIEQGLADADEPNEDVDPEPGGSCRDFDGPVATNTVYLLEGSQLGYFTKLAWYAAEGR